MGECIELRKASAASLQRAVWQLMLTWRTEGINCDALSVTFGLHQYGNISRRVMLLPAAVKLRMPWLPVCALQNA